MVATTCTIVSAATIIGVLAWVLRSPSQTSATWDRLEMRLLVLGLAMVVLSFPAYLLLDSATSHWRTQLLGGPGAGITLASAVAIVAQHRWHWPQSGTWTAAGLTAAICAAGVWASQGSAFKHRLDWEKHRAVVAGMLSAVPRVTDDTVLILVNHRTEPMIFGHNMWWDYAVRLAYPTQSVAGVYYDKPSQATPGVNVYFVDSSELIESDAPMLIDNAQIGQLLILDALPGNRVRVAQTLPDWLGIAPKHRQLYHPQNRIGPWPPDERAMRRSKPARPQ
jgi:hypothetical protein